MQTKPISWASLVEQFYPNLSSNLKSVIAAVLQESDPQEVVGLQHSNIKEEAPAAFLDGYAAKLEPAKPCAPVKYAEEQINGILNNLYRDAYRKEANFGSPNKAFLDKLSMSKSNGKSDAEITIKIRHTFTRKYQVREARLTDYRRATKEKFTTAEFKQDPAL